MGHTARYAPLFYSQSISRVLCPLRGVCHSSMQCVTTKLKRSTLRLGRATLKRRFTWTCSLQDTRPVHRCTAGGLLPHLLTLTPTLEKEGRLFSSALLCLHRQLSVRKWSALRCPDFPPLPYGNGDRPNGCCLCVANLVKKCVKYAVCVLFSLQNVLLWPCDDKKCPLIFVTS